MSSRIARSLSILLAALLLPCCKTDVGTGDEASVITAMVSQAKGDVKVLGFCAGTPAISFDGRFVAFDSDSAALVSGDINGKRDVFRKDRLTGDVALISLGDVGGQVSDDASILDMSGDGNRILFTSQGTFSGYTNSNVNIFLRDHPAGRTYRITGNIDPASAVFYGAISRNGRYVAFASYEDLGFGVPAGSQIYVMDLNANLPGLNTAAPILMLASRAAGGGGTTPANGSSSEPRLVGDGPGVVFSSNSTNLPNAATGYQIYLAVPDAATPASTTVELVSAIDALGTPSSGSCGHPSVSDDGRYVAFETTALNLDPMRIALRDRTGNSTTSIYDEHYAGGLVLSVDPRISPDGRFVTFDSGASLVLPASGVEDVYARDRLGGFERISLDSFGNFANGNSHGGRFSGDGRWVAFRSAASNLAVGDINGLSDIFVRGPRK